MTALRVFWRTCAVHAIANLVRVCTFLMLDDVVSWHHLPQPGLPSSEACVARSRFLSAA